MDNLAKNIYFLVGMNRHPQDARAVQYWRLDWVSPADLKPALLDVGQATSRQRLLTRPLTHPAWLLDYSLTDSGWYQILPGTEWTQRKPHEAHLYPPDLRYRENTRPIRGQMRCLFLSFVGGHLAGLPVGERPPYRFLKFSDPERQLQTHMERLLQIAQRRGREGFWEAQGVFYQILALLREDRGRDPNTVTLPAGAPRVRSLAREVNAYFRRHYAEPISIATLSRALKVSASVLSHRYGRETGVSPMAALNLWRINITAVLLRKGMPLKVIADQVGFSNEFYLSKTFKRLTGTSPRDYVRTMQSQKPEAWSAQIRQIYKTGCLGYAEPIPFRTDGEPPA